ncbi:MAG: PAS domain S-box protein [Marinilabiliales bacterium]|nr:PAS domain S-box protein [Marinilabiliales bacterium]
MISLLSGGFFQRILSGNAFARYKEVFDQAGFAIMLIDNKTNRFIKVNRAASELFGYTVEELQKMTPSISPPNRKRTGVCWARSPKTLL